MALSIFGCKKNSDTIYFVPIGDAPTAEINDLASHYREKFKLDVQVLPAIKVSETDVDTRRGQLVAENLVQTMLHFSDRIHGNDVLIGITSEDMYPRSQQWQFCFGWRVADSRAAVVSTARMDLHYPGEPAGEATLRNRLRKVVTKDIGILFYHKSLSSNPRSVLYDKILGIEELDYASEDF
jgi:predicted Zn-dependent protease